MPKSATMDAVSVAVLEVMCGAQTGNPLVAVVAPFVARARAQQANDMTTQYPSPADTAFLAVELFKESTNVII